MLTSFVIVDCFRLKVIVHLRSELLLQAVRVETEQTLQAIAEAKSGILDCHLPELVVHRLIEILTQEE